MFDPILVPLDGSLLAECVLPHVMALGQAFNANIILLHVLDRDRAGASGQLFDLLNWQINKTEAKLYLERIGDRLQKLGLPTKAIVLEGVVPESITEFAQRQGTKLIVLSSHGRGGLRKWGISSVTQKIILSAPTSILIVRAHQSEVSQEVEQHYSRILMPLDGSRRAENLLPIVAQLGHFHKSQIHIVHVVETPDMARPMPLAHEDVDLSNRIVARNREEALRYLEQARLSTPLAGDAVPTHLLTSHDAAAALHELVKAERISLVALSAHGYSGNDQWPYGSLVDNFILYGQVPLLIVQDLPAKEEANRVEMASRVRAGH